MGPRRRWVAPRVDLAAHPIVPVILAAMLMFLALFGCSDRAVCLEADRPDPVPRCADEAGALSCAHGTVVCEVRALDREVHWQLPEGEAPADGWPVAVLYQGSFLSAERTWEAEPDDDFGGWHQTRLVEALLGAGFAVLTPETRYDGATYWDTNVLPWSVSWEKSADHRLVEAIFDGVDGGVFGPLDPDALYAAGISSGGYMTSRMAEAYPGRFRALAIQSASWATCSGAICDLPKALPADHPPTLFLHGEDDLIVPVGTMQKYADALEAQGTEVDVVREAEVGHAWLPVAPEAIVAWFDR